MPQDLCQNARAPAPRAAPLAPIAALLLAVLAVAALTPAPTGPDNTQPPTPEDWHGNVMRSAPAAAR
ncbi:MAG: hypothetical protein ACNA7M_09035 [Roseovarius sp.]